MVSGLSVLRICITPCSCALGTCSPWPSTIAALVRGTVVQLSSCECALSQRPSSTSSSRWNASSDRERSVFRTGCSGDDPRPASCPRARVQRRESIARSQATSFRRFASVLVLAGTKLGMATVPHMKVSCRLFSRRNWKWKRSRPNREQKKTAAESMQNNSLSCIDSAAAVFFCSSDGSKLALLLQEKNSGFYLKREDVSSASIWFLGASQRFYYSFPKTKIQKCVVNLP